MSAPPTGVIFYDARAKPLSTTGAIQPGAYYQFYTTQTLTPANVYADGSLTTPLSQTPGTGATTAASDGRLPVMYLNPTVTYRYQLYSSLGVLLQDVDPFIPVVALLPTQAQVGAILYPQTAAELSAGVSPTNLTYPPTPIGDARRYCTLILDGSTDNTSSISGMWSALSTYRGPVTIPYNCKFNKATVYSTIPVGVILYDQSSVNTGQPPGYKNKRPKITTNDTVSDDTVQEVESSHHPAIRLNNLHTASSASATSRFHSILFAAGYRWTNDPIDGIQYLTSLSTRVSPPNYLWRNSWVTNTKAQAAILSSHWTGATLYTTGAVVDTTDGNVWINNGGSGTSAGTEPTGTGPTFNDGGLTWTWLFAWNIASTLFFFDEDGYGGITGSTGRWGVDGPTRKGPSLNINDSTHDTFLRDDQRSQDFWRITDTAGLRQGGVLSLNYSGAISGATPTISGSMHTVTNGGATNMTNILLPGSQTSGYVVLYFTNANTTVKSTGFNLKGGIDVTPVAGNIITFFKEPSISGSWTEISRNF